jgi:hypothetical protein
VATRTRNAAAIPDDAAGQKLSHGEDVRAEYLAEAIRAYLANPNYLKTVAPMTAASIRATVNENPRLRGIIQFDSGGDPLFGGGLLGNLDR